MEDKLYLPKIWLTFKEYYRKNYCSETDWTKFISSIDIGLSCYQCSHYYTITDEKKWIINKIKYGF
jgi:hypothetical protein